MRLRFKVLIGAFLGLVGGAAVLMRTEVGSGGSRAVAGLLIFGPLFGGAVAFFLDRYEAPLDEALSLRSRPEGVGRVAAAGAMAGGGTGGVAYLLGFLPSPWYILGGFAFGAVLVVSYWVYANIERH